VEGSLSEGERQRLAALAAATANGLLVMFVLAVALEPGSRRYRARRRLVRRCSPLVMVGFLPLQGLAAWRGMEAAQSLSFRAGRVQQTRLAQFRQAVERSATMAELQNQLAAIQAPPLSAADQHLGLPALKADLLAQIKSQQSSLQKQGGPRVPVEVMIKDGLRVVLLAPLLALAFSVSARRSSRTEVPA
jgi:hypothetical protein